jgi:hypothetical protein
MQQDLNLLAPGKEHREAVPISHTNDVGRDQVVGQGGGTED